MADIHSEDSNTNTILLVILIVAVVAFGMYFLLQGKFFSTQAQPQGVDLNVNVSAPSGNTAPGNSGGGGGGGY